MPSKTKKEKTQERIAEQSNKRESSKQEQKLRENGHEIKIVELAWASDAYQEAIRKCDDCKNEEIRSKNEIDTTIDDWDILYPLCRDCSARYDPSRGRVLSQNTIDRKDEASRILNRKK